MKKLILTQSSHRVVLEKFSEWLDILGYAPSTCYIMPCHVREFLHYLEQRKQSVGNVSSTEITSYYKYLRERPGKFGALSAGSLNKHQQGLKLLAQFMRKHGKVSFPVRLKTEKAHPVSTIKALTQSEIQQLFIACDKSHEKDYFRQRDKALLVVFYSCGLRRNEAVHLDLCDVMFDKEVLFVRYGKNNKDRMVPINDYNLRILEDYIFDARPHIHERPNTEALFIGKFGKRFQGVSMERRLKAIVQASGIATNPNGWQGKRITLHMLRHSIATHLLQQGMDIEQISQFLGHSSLESTQIYTHIMKQL